MFTEGRITDPKAAEEARKKAALAREFHQASLKAHPEKKVPSAELKGQKIGVYELDIDEPEKAPEVQVPEEGKETKAA